MPFEWRIPVAEIAGEGPIIEDERAPPQSESPTLEPSAPDTAPAPRPARRNMPRRADAVIPLMHAPDDPGPERERRREPRPEPASNGWLQRWFR